MRQERENTAENHIPHPICFCLKGIFVCLKLDATSWAVVKELWSLLVFSTGVFFFLGLFVLFCSHVCRFAIGNEPRSLEELNLSDCNLDAVVISALVRRDGVVATLKEIDLSHNVLSGSIGASLTAMAKDSQCLRRINISNTRVDVDTVESFLKALAANEFLDSLEIDLSHNLLKVGFAIFVRFPCDEISF